MADTSAAAGLRVNAFQVSEDYLVKHYFEGEAVFERLRRHYDHEGYRFVVPTSEFDGVRRFLAERDYDLVPVVALAPYVVAVRKYTAHPEGIFKESVAQWDRHDHTLFLLKDERAVDRAVANGAVRLRDTEYAVETGSRQRRLAV